MSIEYTAEELIVGDNPTIIKFHFTVNASSLHSQLGSKSTIIRPSPAVQWLAIMIYLWIL